MRFIAFVISLFVSPLAIAVPQIPEVGISCPGHVSVHALFTPEFSLWGPVLNEFAGRAVTPSTVQSDLQMQVRGHQVQNARNDEPTFWLLNISSGDKILATLTLEQSRESDRVAYGKLRTPNGQTRQVKCSVEIEYNGIDQPSSGRGSPRLFSRCTGHHICK